MKTIHIPGGEYYTAASAAAKWGVDPSHVRRLSSQGRLPALRIGRTWLLPSEAVEGRSGPTEAAMSERAPAIVGEATEDEADLVADGDTGTEAEQVVSRKRRRRRRRRRGSRMGVSDMSHRPQ